MLLRLVFSRSKLCYCYSTKIPLLPFTSFHITEESVHAKHPHSKLFPFNEELMKFQQNKNWTEFISWINTLPIDSNLYFDTKVAILFKMMQMNFPFEIFNQVVDGCSQSKRLIRMYDDELIRQISTRNYQAVANLSKYNVAFNFKSLIQTILQMEKHPIRIFTNNKHPFRIILSNHKNWGLDDTEFYTPNALILLIHSLWLQNAIPTDFWFTYCLDTLIFQNAEQETKYIEYWLSQWKVWSKKRQRECSILWKLVFQKMKFFPLEQLPILPTPSNSLNRDLSFDNFIKYMQLVDASEYVVEVAISKYPEKANDLILFLLGIGKKNALKPILKYMKQHSIQMTSENYSLLLELFYSLKRYQLFVAIFEEYAQDAQIQDSHFVWYLESLCKVNKWRKALKLYETADYKDLDILVLIYLHSLEEDEQLHWSNLLAFQQSDISQFQYSTLSTWLEWYLNFNKIKEAVDLFQKVEQVELLSEEVVSNLVTAVLQSNDAAMIKQVTKRVK